MHEVIARRFRATSPRSRRPASGTDGQPSRRRRPRQETPAEEVGGPIDPDDGPAAQFAYPPQLVVVDGGQPQVAAAQRALDELGIDDVAVCGLAKRLEEVWLPGDDDPVILPRTSEGLYLLQRVRDEAHRFAITYQRSQARQAIQAGPLDDVPGPRRDPQAGAAQALRFAEEAAGRDDRPDLRGSRRSAARRRRRSPRPWPRRPRPHPR